MVNIVKQIKNIPIDELIANSTSGEITTEIDNTTRPVIFRGITKIKGIKECKKQNRDFYYTDSGYLGNFKSVNNPTGVKLWHRIVKNNLQQVDLLKVPEDRWAYLQKHDSRLVWRGWKDYDKKILVIVPTDKTCKAYEKNLDEWLSTTIQTLKQHTNIPIELRHKKSRRDRNNFDVIYDEFNTGVYATVSLSSIAAVESVVYGIPAFCTDPCAGSILASNDLTKINEPYKPPVDLIYKHCCNLSYGQYTLEEIYNGTAWRNIKKYYQ